MLNRVSNCLLQFRSKVLINHVDTEDFRIALTGKGTSNQHAILYLTEG